MILRRAVSRSTKYAVLEAHGHRCHYCKQDNASHVDHIIPIARGGSNEPENLIAACPRCNMAKRANILPVIELREALNAAWAVKDVVTLGSVNPPVFDDGWRVFIHQGLASEPFHMSSCPTMHQVSAMRSVMRRFAWHLCLLGIMGQISVNNQIVSLAKHA